MTVEQSALTMLTIGISLVAITISVTAAVRDALTERRVRARMRGLRNDVARDVEFCGRGRGS